VNQKIEGKLFSEVEWRSSQSNCISNSQVLHRRQRLGKQDFGRKKRQFRGGGEKTDQRKKGVMKPWEKKNNVEKRFLGGTSKSPIPLPTKRFCLTNKGNRKVLRTSQETKCEVKYGFTAWQGQKKRHVLRRGLGDARRNWESNAHKKGTRQQGRLTKKRG